MSALVGKPLRRLFAQGSNVSVGFLQIFFGREACKFLPKGVLRSEPVKFLPKGVLRSESVEFLPKGVLRSESVEFLPKGVLLSESIEFLTKVLFGGVSTELLPEFPLGRILFQLLTKVVSRDRHGRRSVASSVPAQFAPELRRQHPTCC